MHEPRKWRETHIVITLHYNMIFMTLYWRWYKQILYDLSSTSSIWSHSFNHSRIDISKHLDVTRTQSGPLPVPNGLAIGQIPNAIIGQKSLKWWNQELGFGFQQPSAGIWNKCWWSLPQTPQIYNCTIWSSLQVLSLSLSLSLALSLSLKHISLGTQAHPRVFFLVKHKELS